MGVVLVGRLPIDGERWHRGVHWRPAARHTNTMGRAVAVARVVAAATIMLLFTSAGGHAGELGLQWFRSRAAPRFRLGPRSV